MYSTSVTRIESGAYTLVREHFNPWDNAAIEPNRGLWRSILEPFLGLVSNPLQRLNLNGAGYLGFDIEDIFIKYAAE